MRRSLWNFITAGSLILLAVSGIVYYQIVTGRIELPTGPRPLLEQSESDQASSLASTGLTPDQPAPDFTLPALDGEPVSLSEYRGQPLLINFWATWCPYCREEMAAIERVYTRHREDGFLVLAINVQESEDTVRALVEEVAVSFPILLDESGDVMELYKVRGLPSNFFVASDGTIHVRRVGEVTEEFIEETLAEMASTGR